VKHNLQQMQGGVLEKRGAIATLAASRGVMIVTLFPVPLSWLVEKKNNESLALIV
jgi:hypothetical protein